MKYLLNNPYACVNFVRGGCSQNWVHCEPETCQDFCINSQTELAIRHIADKLNEPCPHEPVCAAGRKPRRECPICWSEFLAECKGE